MTRAVIVGMGFGGLNVARKLANQKDIDLLLIDQNNYHLFQPLLYQVATATIEQEQVAYPVRATARGWRNARFLLTEVSDIDLEKKTLKTAGGPVPYDTLVLAPGAVTRWPGIKGIRENSFELKTLADAVVMRNHILGMFEQAAREKDPVERDRLLTFVIAGGGPMGVEFCGALAELVQQVMQKDYPEIAPEDVKVLLLEAAPHLLSIIPAELRGYATRRLEQLGVDVRLNAKVTRSDDRSVTLEDGTTIPCGMLLWAAGIKAAPLAEGLDAADPAKGRVIVGPDLTLPGHPEVFVIGDAAYVEQDGAPLGAIAPVAIQMGEYAGETILRRHRGEAVKPFHYFDKGVMAVIGRGAAASRVFNVKLTGFLAWVSWAVLHIFMLIGFRNRLLVLINWAYDYLFFDRKIRLITWTRKGAER
jgi:NADH dehydrogenase